MTSRVFPNVDAALAAKAPLEALAALFETARPDFPPSVLAADGADAATPPLIAQPLAAPRQASQKPAAATAWRLSAKGVNVDSQRAPVVFIEAGTPAVAAPAHGLWAEWQRAAVQGGHAAWSVVLARGPAGGADEDVCAQVDACIRAASADGPPVVVLRFDAAPLLYRCAALRTMPIRELVVGPMPLWPLPTQPAGEYPLRTLYTLLGWMGAGNLSGAQTAAWQLLHQAATAVPWPGLAQAAVWQEDTARAGLPAEAAAQALAALMGPWLLPGITSVLADDWAVRQAGGCDGVAPACPLRVLFRAQDCEPSRQWASHYAQDLFGALGAQIRVELQASDDLRLPAGKAPAKPRERMAVRPARKVSTPVRAVAKTARPAKPRVQDDLTRIEGIGPKIAGLLNKAGITTFEGLSRAAPKRLQAILDQAGARFTLARPETWPKQSTLLAKGNEKAFAALVARLRGGVAV